MTHVFKDRLAGPCGCAREHGWEMNLDNWSAWGAWQVVVMVLVFTLNAWGKPYWPT